MIALIGVEQTTSLLVVMIIIFARFIGGFHAVPKEKSIKNDHTTEPFSMKDLWLEALRHIFGFGSLEAFIHQLFRL